MSNPKRTIVATAATAEVETMRNEDVLKISFSGISRQNYATDADYSKRFDTDVYIPLWCIRYIVQQQRAAIEAYEKKQLERLSDIKKAFNP